ISSLVPAVGLGNSAPAVLAGGARGELAYALLANTASYIFDYATRQKLGGTNLTFGAVQQLPILDPAALTATTLRAIVPRVTELVTSSWVLRAHAQISGVDCPPFPWDEERRFWLRAELDALFFHLYGISRDDVDYIME